MSFLSVFQSQVPGIIKRLENVRSELAVTQKNIEHLLLFEETFSGRTEELAKLVMDNLDVATWLKDLDGRFLYANKACCKKILKCSLEEALNLTNGDLKKDALAQVCMQSDRAVIKSQVTMRFVEHAIYNGDVHIWIDTVKSPVFSSKKLIGITGNAVNITNDIPLIIREKHTKASSIEVPISLALCEKHLIEYLERRKESRT